MHEAKQVVGDLLTLNTGDGPSSHHSNRTSKLSSLILLVSEPLPGLQLNFVQPSVRQRINESGRLHLLNQLTKCLYYKGIKVNKGDVYWSLWG